MVQKKLPGSPALQAIARTPSAAVQHDPLWMAVRSRETSADGSFFYAVKTTGVYCRPSCAARLPKRQNVAFYSTRADAEQAGFRPCKRCKPDQPPLSERQMAQVTQLCRLIEASDAEPPLQQLANHVGLSLFHVQRLFKSITGLTPKAYAAAHRAKRLGQQLQAKNSVTTAMVAAGYRSSARFYRTSSKRLGMTPSQYRGGAMNLVIRFAVGPCSLGAILVAATERGVCAVLLGDDAAALVHELERRFRHAQLVGADRSFEQLVAQVVGLVERPQLGTKLPLDIRGTAFQQRVWQALLRIPCGETVSYSELARQLGTPSAARAVAQACAANPLAVAVPCHRVVRRDGSLSGYRWGVERKRQLLDRESNPT